MIFEEKLSFFIKSAFYFPQAFALINLSVKGYLFCTKGSLISKNELSISLN
jgi:hypothetical protein